MFILPTERAKQVVLDDTLEDGWRIKTSVSPSKVADGAGNGRFAVDDVPRMRVAMLKPHVEMSEVKSLAALAIDTTITFSKTEDLTKFVDLAQNESNLTVEQIHNFFSNFMFGLDGERGLLNMSSLTVNHSEMDSCNLVLTHDMNEGKECLVFSTKANDVAKGDELTCDYRLFKLPKFYLDYCDKHNFQDVRTIVVNAVDGGGSPPPNVVLPEKK